MVNYIDIKWKREEKKRKRGREINVKKDLLQQAQCFSNVEEKIG